MRPAKGHGYAYRCETCDALPDFRVERVGDAMITWACTEHLGDACLRFARDEACLVGLDIRSRVTPT